VQDTVTSHMKDLLAYHGISVNISERLRPDGSLDTGTLAEARDLAIIITEMVMSYGSVWLVAGARLQTRLWWPNESLLNRNGIGRVTQSQPDSDCYSDSLIANLQVT